MTAAHTVSSGFAVSALSAETWGPYAAMVERHKGVFGGCWCTWFHRPAGDALGVEGLGEGYESNRRIKEGLVRQGRSRAAVVFDGDEAIGWCQFGTPRELPNIYHRKQYLEELEKLPDFRITCIFVDKRYRRRGVSALALEGALDLIAASGGGVVEGYPHDTQGKRQSVLYSGTRSLFERAGFVLDRPKGAKNTVMVRTVHPAQN